MRIIFMGSPDFAAIALEALIAAGRDIICVYCQPPRPAGRGQALRLTPTHAVADRMGLVVRTPKSLKKAEAQQAFADLKADLAVVVAYGLILPQPILDGPRLGCVNLHGSLLPRWRGAAPIQRAIMAGDVETGVQVMWMEAGLDTGPVLMTARVPIAPDDTAQSLHDKLARAGAPLLLAALTAIENGSAVATPQAETGATYAAKIDPTEAKIDWARPARAVDAHIRGLSPYPGAWFWLPGASGAVRVKALMSCVAPGASGGLPGRVLDDALTVACAEGAVRLLTVQREGRQALPVGDFLRGAPVAPGTQLG